VSLAMPVSWLGDTSRLLYLHRRLLSATVKNRSSMVLPYRKIAARALSEATWIPVRLLVNRTYPTRGWLL
jgi:hypothetical protein